MCDHLEDDADTESGGPDARTHCERFGVVVYEVVAPPVSQIRNAGIWGSRVGSDEVGGASFAQTLEDGTAVVTTGLVYPETHTSSDAQNAVDASRPGGLVGDRLRDIRYPDDFVRYGDAEWRLWLAEVSDEIETWILDNTRWVPVAIDVDGTRYEGVATTVDSSFSAAGFPLPEGRLDVAIEVTAHGRSGLVVGDLQIVRTTDLSRVEWCV